MKQLNSNFRNAKVGDPVYHFDGRIGTIINIDANIDYPVLVQNDNRRCSYTMDGKYVTEHTYPSIFTHPIKIIHADDEPFAERLMEVSNNGSTWSKRVVFMKKDGYYMAWFMAETIEAAQTEFDTSLWKYSREIQPVNPRIAEIERYIQQLQSELKTLKEASK